MKKVLLILFLVTSKLGFIVAQQVIQFQIEGRIVIADSTDLDPEDAFLNNFASIVIEIDSCSMPYVGLFCVASIEKSWLAKIDCDAVNVFQLEYCLPSRTADMNTLELIRSIPPTRLTFSITSSMRYKVTRLF